MIGEDLLKNIFPDTDLHGGTSAVLEASKKIKLPVYVNFLIVYAFNLKGSKDKFHVFKNSIRVYYSLKYDEGMCSQLEIKKHINHLDLEIGEVLYQEYIKPFHSENEAANSNENEPNSEEA